MNILGMELDLIEEEVFNFQVVDMVNNVFIFGVDLSFTTHIDNKKRHSSIRNRSNTRIRTCFNCRKKVFF